MDFINTKLEEFNNYLRGRKVAIIGIGVSNIPLIEYFHDLKSEVTVFDNKEIDDIDKTVVDKIVNFGMSFSFGKNYLEKLSGFDIIFRSPSCLPTVPELVETGEYIINATDYIMYDTNVYPVIACSDVAAGLHYPDTSTNSRIFSGCKYFTFTDNADAAKFIEILDSDAKGDAIIAVFMVPGTLWNKLNKNEHTDTVNGITCHYYAVYSTSGMIIEQQKTVSMQTTLNGYTPKNKKLFIGKYNYFYISNNSGIEAEYHYEDFYNNTPTFELIGAFAQGGSMKLVPKNYLKYRDVNDSRYFYNYGITGPKYPICSWNSDSYAIWTSENSLNRAIDTTKNVGSMALGIAGTAVGLASGNMGLAVAGGASILSGSNGVLNTLKEGFVRSRMSDQVQGNTNSGDVQYASGKCCYTIFKMSVKQEYAKVIDDYFSMYGYKVNSLKIPNVTGRTNWNYVKTIGCNFEGNIPQGDLNEIKNMFNTGVTFWHNPSTYLDYSQTNTIVS